MEAPSLGAREVEAPSAGAAREVEARPDEEEASAMEVDMALVYPGMSSSSVTIESVIAERRPGQSPSNSVRRGDGTS